MIFSPHSGGAYNLPSVIGILHKFRADLQHYLATRDLVSFYCSAVRIVSGGGGPRTYARPNPLCISLVVEPGYSHRDDGMRCVAETARSFNFRS